MARALENPDAKPTYLDYFGMTRPPFAKLSEPSQLFHSDQYSLLADHLASATEQPDFLLVICGANGSGKTALLNRHILSLDNDVSYATFDETCADGTQFYSALLRQLGFHDITGKLNELRNIAREFLIHRGKAGDPVLLIIDNAHLVCASVLEQLRRIAETKIDYRRVLSIVLAGNSDLPRIMGSPAMKKLKFQRHVDFNIRVYTEQETEDYVRHRLRLSGGADATKLSNDAYPVIYRFTGGIPNSINALCNAVLTEACALDTRVITGDLVRSVADTHEILPHVVPLQGKGRRKTDPNVPPVVPEPQAEERIIAREPPAKPAVESSAAEPAVDIKPLLNQVSQLSGQLAIQTKKTETLSHTVSENEGRIKRLHQELSDTKRALQESESAANQLTARANVEIENLEREKSELQESCKQLSADLKLSNMRADKTDALEKSLQESKDECEALKSEAAESRKEMNAAKKATTAAAKAEAKIEKLAKENSELRASVKDLSGDRKLANKQATKIDALEKSLRKSQDQCESLRAKAAESRKEMNAAKKATTANVEARTEKLEQDNSELRALVEDLSAGLKVANKRADKIDALEKSLKESRDECESLRSGADKLETLQKSVSERDARINELETELDSMMKAETSTQPELPDERSTTTRVRPMPDSPTEQSAHAIATIEVLRNGKIEQLMDIADGPSRIMIGRGDDCELRLDSKFVSRHHALIFCSAERVYIEDLNSFNGTLVNGKKVARCDLQPDDKVVVGNFQLRPGTAVKNDPV
ncbi:MAG: FHA domain-containing protein [Gammaproteobacteria bacterium]|nr:FHA domain-containing protein [Gammaproteobacteria bacterium]